LLHPTFTLIAFVTGEMMFAQNLIAGTLVLAIGGESLLIGAHLVPNEHCHQEPTPPDGQPKPVTMISTLATTNNALNDGTPVYSMVKLLKTMKPLRGQSMTFQH
jgi:hypothetical protein